MDKKNKNTKAEVKSESKKSGNGKLTELREQVKKAKEELANLRLEKVQRKLKNTASVTLKRKEIARLLTAMRQLELTNAENI